MVLVLLITMVTPAFAADCTSVTLPFITTRSLMLVQVTIDGQRRTMAFDTAAESTLLYGASQREDRKVPVTVGERTWGSFLISFMPQQRLLPGIDGLLGQDVMRQFSTVTVDYKSKTITMVK